MADILFSAYTVLRSTKSDSQIPSALECLLEHLKFHSINIKTIEIPFYKYKNKFTIIIYLITITTAEASSVYFYFSIKCFELQKL